MRSPGLRFRRIVLVLSEGSVRKLRNYRLEMEELKQLVVTMVGREKVGCASSSGGDRGEDRSDGVCGDSIGIPTER